MNITRQGSVYFFLVNVVQQLRKISLLILLFSFSSAYPQNNLDSLIATWNKLSEDYLKINEIDSACKYGNCVVDLMDQ